MRHTVNWLVEMAIVAMLGLGLAACSTASPQAEQKTTEPKEETTQVEKTETTTEKTVGVSINLQNDSILRFDDDAAAAQLVKDMEEGKTPTSCTVLYDQMGSRPSVTVTDAKTIREVYKKLARMRVAGESNMSVTDSYHMVSFELQDGTKLAYSFEGEGVLTRNGKNYAVIDRGDLWSYVRFLQEQHMRDESAGPDWLAIELEDEDDMVIQCPTSAPAGETVKVIVYDVLDAEIHVAVNGSESFGTFLSSQEYEFVMPDSPVSVRVWLSTDGYAGA